MNLKKMVLVLLAIFTLSSITAQEQKKQLRITGKVTDFNNKPIANAIIYIDSVKTEIVTNRRGLYKLKLASDIKHLGSYTAKYGLLSTTYAGEEKIDFVYRDPNDIAGIDNLKIGMAYKQDIVNPNNSINRGRNYEDYASVAQLLRARFPYVTGGGGVLQVGKGISTYNGDPNPIIIIDDRRSNVRNFLTLSTIDIEHIRVLRRGSEAAQYGSLGASNGVIIVKLKGRL